MVSAQKERPPRTRSEAGIRRATQAVPAILGEGGRKMSRVQELEREVQELSRDELAAFRQWFQEYDAAQWDRQIEADVLAGKLDSLAEQALAEHQAGRTKEL